MPIRRRNVRERGFFAGDGDEWERAIEDACLPGKIAEHCHSIVRTWARTPTVDG
jgi:hypothetical protein